MLDITISPENFTTDIYIQSKVFLNLIKRQFNINIYTSFRKKASLKASVNVDITTMIIPNNITIIDEPILNTYLLSTGQIISKPDFVKSYLTNTPMILWYPSRWIVRKTQKTNNYKQSGFESARWFYINSKTNKCIFGRQFQSFDGFMHQLSDEHNIDVNLNNIVYQKLTDNQLKNIIDEYQTFFAKPKRILCTLEESNDYGYMSEHTNFIVDFTKWENEYYEFKNSHIDSKSKREMIFYNKFTKETKIIRANPNNVTKFLESAKIGYLNEHQLGYHTRQQKLIHFSFNNDDYVVQKQDIERFCSRLSSTHPLDHFKDRNTTRFKLGRKYILHKTIDVKDKFIDDTIKELIDTIVVFTEEFSKQTPFNITLPSTDPNDSQYINEIKNRLYHRSLDRKYK